MTGREEGFSLVEVIVAMLLLGLVAISLVPLLWQGLSLADRQSTVATATREVNALVEQARETPSCADLAALAGAHPYLDASGRTLFTATVTVGTCASETSVSVDVVATHSSGTLAGVSALVYVP